MSPNFVKMSRRLKELRVGYKTDGDEKCKPLSHDALRRTLEVRGVSVSRDTLINYERDPSDKFAARRGTCPGMSAENLVALARLYEVRADYILGLTDTKTTDDDIATACVTTGLNESAVEKLGAICHARDVFDEDAAEHRAEVLNALITCPEFEPLIDMIVHYNEARGHVDEQQWRYGVPPEPTANEVAEQKADLWMFRTTKYLTNFMQHIGDTNAEEQKQRLADKKKGG